ncbi:MAG TPA: serine/threonine-protein kinase [Thermoanaerobaculia bacterium]|nr:serine/threonine-protein kinase [Thermoanaerobaculia bacterium]
MSTREEGESREAARIGAYELRGHLGTGGMGEVFLAWDRRLARHVALKRIRPDVQSTPERRERFRREARAAAALSHPAIVRVYDLLEGEAGDSLVMEYVEGRPLAHLMAEGQIGVARAVRLARQVAEGLASAHALGLIHRDLKAENVMVTADGQAKILDFGLAKQAAAETADESLTREGAVLGTLRTMSPEQAGGEEVDARSDLYSLGVLLYEMLTGRSPFQGGSLLQIHRKVLTERPVPPRLLRPELPAGLSDLVESLLEKDPARRPQSAAEVVEALERIGSASGLSQLGPAASSRPLELPSDASTLFPAPAPVPAVAAQESTARSRRLPALLLLGLAVLAVAAILALKLGAPGGRPIRVQVLEPEVKAASPGELGLVTAGVREAALSTLFSLRGLEVLDLSGLEAAGATETDEILRTEIRCEGGETCRISFRRLQGGRIAGLAQPFFVSVRPEDSLDLAEAVRRYLPAAYPDHPPRSDAVPEFRPEDYTVFIRLRQRNESGEVLGEPELRELQALLQRSPRLSGAYVLAAEVARTLGPQFLERSLDLARQGHELAPWDPRPLATQVLVELQRDRLDEAEKALEELERLTPGDIQVWKSRARLLEKRGLWEEAHAVWTRVVERRPVWQNLYNLADLEIRMGRAGEARRHLGELLKTSPGNDWGLNKLAELELQLGDPARAEELYGKLAAEKPLGRYLNNRGLAESLLGRFEAAARSYRQALEKDPGDRLTRINLADALRAAGRTAEARELYRALLAELVRDESGGRTLDVDETLFKARCLVQLDQPREAFEEVERAMARPGPKRAESLYHAALVSARVNQRLDALRYAERALSLELGPRWFDDPGFDSVRDGLRPLLAARKRPFSPEGAGPR